MEDTSFSVGGKKLSGKFFKPAIDGPFPAILFLHGWTSKQDRYFELAEALTERGYASLTFDMRGHGASEGDLPTLTRVDFLEDTVAAYDVLANSESVDASRIITVGSSFGGYMAALLSSERACQAICLRAPANYPDSGFDEPHVGRTDAYFEGLFDADKEKWKKTVHPFSETKALDAVHNFRGPVLIIESEKDDVVPREVLQSYADAMKARENLTYVLMKGAPHGLNVPGPYKEEFKETLIAWLAAI